MKYHVNPQTGRINICRASKRDCPLGSDTPHFKSKEEAHTFIEGYEAGRNETFKKLSSNKNNKKSSHGLENIRQVKSDGIFLPSEEH